MTNYGHKRRNIVKVCVKYVSRPLNSCPWLKDFNQSSVGALKNIIVIFKCQCQKDDDGTFDTDTEWDKVDFQKVLFEFAYSVKEVTKLKIKWKLCLIVRCFRNVLKHLAFFWPIASFGAHRKALKV